MKRSLAFLVSVLFCAQFFSFASIATPVTISSIACTAGVCTVTTSSAHSIAAGNPGLCILSSSQTADNICGAAASVPTSTTYTVNSASMTACASSCGTSQPAPLFILRSSQAGYGTQTVAGCMWTFTPIGAAVANAVSACSSVLPSNLQIEVNGALASGMWIEQSINRTFPSSYSATTIMNQLLDLQLAAQIALAAATAPGSDAGLECDVTGCN